MAIVMEDMLISDLLMLKSDTSFSEWLNFGDNRGELLGSKVRCLEYGLRLLLGCQHDINNRKWILVCIYGVLMTY